MLYYNRIDLSYRIDVAISNNSIKFVTTGFLIMVLNFKNFSVMVVMYYHELMEY